MREKLFLSPPLASFCGACAKHVLLRMLIFKRTDVYWFLADWTLGPLMYFWLRCQQKWTRRRRKLCARYPQVILSQWAATWRARRRRRQQKKRWGKSVKCVGNRKKAVMALLAHEYSYKNAWFACSGQLCLSTAQKHSLGVGCYPHFAEDSCAKFLLSSSQIVSNRDHLDRAGPGNQSFCCELYTV